MRECIPYRRISTAFKGDIEQPLAGLLTTRDIYMVTDYMGYAFVYLRYQIHFIQWVTSHFHSMLFNTAL